MFKVYEQNWAGCELIESFKTYEEAEAKVEALEAEGSYESSEEGYCIWSEAEGAWVG